MMRVKLGQAIRAHDRSVLPSGSVIDVSDEEGAELVRSRKAVAINRSVDTGADGPAAEEVKNGASSALPRGRHRRRDMRAED